MLEVATAEPHPNVWNLMSTMRSSLIRMYISMRSPQTGLPTRPTATSSPSSVPTLRGLRKWSSVFSEYWSTSRWPPPDLRYSGDMRRSLSTIPGRTSSTRSTSLSLLQRPNVNSSEPCASSWSRPHEMSVCDGSSVLLEHAEPVATEMPSSRIEQHERLALDALEPEVRVAGQPLGRVAVEVRVGNRGEHLATSRSRIAAIRAASSASSRDAISAAAAMPTMPARFSVPERSPFSWPPPKATGATLTPLRM